MTLNNLWAAAALACASIGLAGVEPASAVTTGTYLGTFSGNDPFGSNLVIQNLNIDSPSLYKCDSGGPTCDGKNENGNVPGEDYADGDFTITFDTLKDPGEYTGGTWSFTANGGETLVPKYLVLKAGNEFGLWDITGFTSGTWDTTVFTKSAISHISFYDTGIVPLPAAAWLLLSGIGALGVAARRRRTVA